MQMDSIKDLKDEQKLKESRISDLERRNTDLEREIRKTTAVKLLTYCRESSEIEY